MRSFRRLAGEDPCQVRLSHDRGKTHASFDDPNLVSRAGLVPVLALAERAGLAALVRELVSVGGPCGVNADLKVGCLVAGMTAGADSIEDMDVLRHGAMPGLFGGIRAPSTLGSFLRPQHHRPWPPQKIRRPNSPGGSRLRRHRYL
jgi:hypothetical protein